MTERQKTMVWKRTQAHRDRFNKSQTREWYKTLMAEIQPVLKEVSPENLSGLAARVPQLMGEDIIKEQLIRTVSMVGPYFAQQSFNAVSKALGTKLTYKLGGLPTDEEWISMMVALLGETAGERITAIVEESRAQAIEIIKSTLQQAVEEGMGTSETSVLLRDNLGGKWGTDATYRAARIARTEVTQASNLGSLVGAQNAGVPLQKVWLSTRDSRTRRRKGPGKYEHYNKFPAGPDGEKRELNERFTKTGESLEYPGDYAGSAGNVINCRCTMYYEPKEIELAT